MAYRDLMLCSLNMNEFKNNNKHTIEIYNEFNVKFSFCFKYLFIPFWYFFPNQTLSRSFP